MLSWAWHSTCTQRKRIIQGCNSLEVILKYVLYITFIGPFTGFIPQTLFLLSSNLVPSKPLTKWIRTRSRWPSQDVKAWVLGESPRINKHLSSLHCPTQHPQDLQGAFSWHIIARPFSSFSAWYLSSCTSASPLGWADTWPQLFL